CKFLKRRFPERGLSVVIAFDVRRYEDQHGTYDRRVPHPLLGTSSFDFAKTAARVYAANGIRAFVASPDSGHFVSTPELSYAIRHLGADGGLNVSASHNHPDDNGAKIYNRCGGQEIPPLDEEMAQCVESVTSVELADWDAAFDSGRLSWIPEDVHESYLSVNASCSLSPSARSARVVFTPLQGTGSSSVGAVLERSGFEVDLYGPQAEPDGSFSNVALRSPNPEVPESLLDATQYARKQGADIVLAADPDADRLGLVANARNADWRPIDGNQIAALLSAYVTEKRPREDGLGFGVTTVVTTSLFRRILEGRGIQVVDDLGIGFKYIADVIERVDGDDGYPSLDARSRSSDFVVGVEESHGYLVTPQVRDKDAAGAGLLLAELASELKDVGRTLFDYLDAIYREFGYVANRLVSTVMRGAAGHFNIRHIQASLRETPPQRIGNFKVQKIIDRQSPSLGPIASETDRASRDLLIYELEEDARVVLRPSGTEPKNKIYIEVRSAPLGNDASDETLAAQKCDVDEKVEELSIAFTQEMLRRIDVDLPLFALNVSDLVPLEWKQDFATFLPDLAARIESSDSPESRDAISAWVHQRLHPYGSDSLLRVREGVRSFVRSTGLSSRVQSELASLFGLETPPRS
ncbi:MAG: hypothetical protein AAF517_22060, partial [Planctomycetota bacterium]